MDDLKQGKKAGLIGIKDAAVVVKDEKGKLKITDTKKRKAKGFVTGGVVGGVIGLIAHPPRQQPLRQEVVWLATSPAN